MNDSETGNITGNMLVFGGTFKMSNGNRALESSRELGPADNQYPPFEEMVNSCYDLDSIANMLDVIGKEGVNIVGSRSYVYSSLLLSNIIMGLKGCTVLDICVEYDMVCIPRTGGLRERVITLWDENRVNSIKNLDTTPE